MHYASDGDDCVERVPISRAPALLQQLLPKLGLDLATRKHSIHIFQDLVFDACNASATG